MAGAGQGLAEPAAPPGRDRGGTRGRLPLLHLQDRAPAGPMAGQYPDPRWPLGGPGAFCRGRAGRAPGYQPKGPEIAVLQAACLASRPATDYFTARNWDTQLCPLTRL